MKYVLKNTYNLTFTYFCPLLCLNHLIERHTNTQIMDDNSVLMNFFTFSQTNFVYLLVSSVALILERIDLL